jgi:cytochrome b6-f complex iron-sulfur subunit
MGFAFFLSSICGIYLLVTDGSLWALAVSHAVGLIMIVVIDALLGIFNLASNRSVYVPSLAAAALGVLLQVGDIATAPQYGMTVYYFAGYLFGLWAFDLLLALQGVVLAMGLVGREYALRMSRMTSRRGKYLDYSRRNFVKIVAEFGALIGVAVALGSIKLPTYTQSHTTQTTQTGLPKGAIVNSNDLQVGSPFYFQYPGNNPSILLKKSDGTLTALSRLCTHVCCSCDYDYASEVLFCPCHGSVFDVSGNVIRGPATLPLPTIRLSVDSAGNVYPKGVSGYTPCMG